MQKLFNKILVPINFSSDSGILLKKAADIAIEYNCSIHLLHVVPFTSPLFTIAIPFKTVPFDRIKNEKELNKQMNKLCSSIPYILKNKLQVGYSIVKGTWDEVIIDMVNNQYYDLVIIGQKRRLFLNRKLNINPDNVAQRINIPVITVPLNRQLTNLGTIVIPVTDFLPVKKIMYGIYLSNQHNTTIKLLGIENKKTEINLQHYLSKAYYLVKDNCTVPIELKIIFGNNVASAVNEFANLNNADLIIMNPETQTTMPGFFSKLITGMLQKHSDFPLLTINLA